MKRVLETIVLLLLLTGCAATPFVDVGMYYSGDAGWKDLDEKGLAATWAVGAEFEDRWYLPSECGIYHRSMVYKRPEVVVNDIGCKKRLRFGRITK